MTHAPSVFRAAGFARLWLAGGIASAMLWLEFLAAALFTLAATGSALAVALVSAARAAPLLVAGPAMGVLADSVNRRLIVLAGLLLNAAGSASVAGLAAAGVLRPWHLGLAALVSGLVYATELPARRRLAVEVAGPSRMGGAVAIDSLTSFATRVVGPLLGGIAVGSIGIAGAYAVSAASSLAAATLVAGVRHAQPRRPLSWGGVGRDLAEAVRFARRSPTVRRLLSITTAMNLFGYSYTALVAPVGHAARLGDTAIGVLAAAEPAGALCGGLLMVSRATPRHPVLWLGGGAGCLFAALLGGGTAPVPVLAAALLLGGFGVAVYTNMQTTLVMQAAPAEIRSRVFGLVGMCVGGWPLGQVLAGAVAEVLSPRAALAVLGGLGLAALLLVAASGRFRRRGGSATVAG